MKQLVVLLLVVTLFVNHGTSTVGADEQPPIHCSVICKYSKTYDCCFAVCVCNTDPDPDVRHEYCADVPDVCAVPRS